MLIILPAGVSLWDEQTIFVALRVEKRIDTQGVIFDAHRVPHHRGLSFLVGSAGCGVRVFNMVAADVSV